MGHALLSGLIFRDDRGRSPGVELVAEAGLDLVLGQATGRAEHRPRDEEGAGEREIRDAAEVRIAD